MILLKRCLHSTCLLPVTISDILTKSSQMIVKMKCEDNHKYVWKSQPNCNYYSVGNLTSAASVLFSANTFQRLSQFFDLAGIQWISKSSFYTIQNRYLHGIVNRTFMLKSKAIIEEIKEETSLISVGTEDATALDTMPNISLILS